MRPTSCATYSGAESFACRASAPLCCLVAAIPDGPVPEAHSVGALCLPMLNEPRLRSGGDTLLHAGCSRLASFGAASLTSKTQCPR